MATIKEVAKKARVSVGTVSNVLGGSVPVSKRLKERVLDVVKQLDYHPNYVARSLKIRQTQTIGMIVSDITNPFVPELVRGAEDAAWRENYMLITFNSDDQPDRERQMLAALRSRQVDGILLMSAGGFSAADGEDLTHSRIPTVCVAREFPGLDLDVAVADNFGGARECIGHLASLGHRAIGMLNGEMGIETARARYLGYCQALEDHRIPPGDRLVISRGFRAEDGYRDGLELLRRYPRPTAVLAANSMLAIGFLRALREMDLNCPGDVALAAFDDPIFAAILRPALTAVGQPTYDLGAAAIGLLLKRIDDPARERSRIVLPTRLWIRESSGSAVAAA